MSVGAVVDRLECFPDAFRAACLLAPPDLARWKPPSGSWSILEIACHVRDEEREDFRVRLQLTIQDPRSPWPPLDLDDISTRRGYLLQDLSMVLREFAELRAANVAWLRSWSAEIDLSRAYEHPKWGPIAAGMLLSAWPAHDALHLRQVAKRLYELAEVQTGFSPRYAGEWGV